MKQTILRLVLVFAAVCGAVATGPAQAVNTRGADTDLFANTNTNTSGIANILFVIDNGASASSNVSAGGETCNIDSSGNVVTTSGVSTNATALSGKVFGITQCSLYAALNSITPTSPAAFNIAIMMFNSSGMKTFNPSTNAYTSDCSGSDGGCVVMPLTSFTSTNKTNMLAWIKAWTISGSGDSNVKGPAQDAHGASLQEAWAFWLGKTGVSGRGYTAPSSSTGCGKDFVVFLGEAYSNTAKPGDGTGTHGPKDPLTGSSATSGKNASPAATTAEKTLLSGTYTARYNIGSNQITCTSGSSTSQSYSTSDGEGTGTYGLNWAKYMKNQHSIKTYTIGLLGANCLPSYSTWLDLLADSGGGQFFPASDAATLKSALQTVLTQIISVNSVFASVSLPVSVNTQGSYLNQVYIGMFRPDSTYLPKWYGNLKQFKLATVGTNLKLVDADGTAAINTTTGFITECARSFWTPTTTDTYWANATNGTCSTISGAAASNYPDGNVVEKGAHAYQLRTITPANRVVKTCGLTNATCTSLIDFSTTSLSSVAASNFGDTTTTADRDLLINWARGLNNHPDGAVEISQASTVMRASTHGDVMHSRPVAVNYGTDNSPSVVVYYGANDGMLHAVNGNQTGNIVSGGNTYVPGQEIWSFVPPEYYSSIQRNYENTVPVFYQGTAASNAVDKYYAMDGPFTAFKGTISGVSKTYLYATMRRGGRKVYAFDVTTPGSPSLLWKAGCTSSTPASMMSASDCTVGSNDFEHIGQTWGSPQVFYASAYGSGATPLILMAGGYDTCEDTDTGTANHNCGSSAKGTRVYVLDGTNGNIVKEWSTVAPWTGGNPRPVVGDATIANNSSGIAQYAYVGDMGGVVYRMNFTGNNTSNWSFEAIAKVGCATVATACTANRKFMFQPSVVPDPDGSTYWVLIGSGDREKPTSQHVASGTVSNYFFAIKDVPSSSINSYLSSEQPNCSNEKIICLASLQAIDGSTGSSSAATLSAISGKKGWYLGLSSTEQVVTSALTQFGNTTFSTHMPAVSSSSCSNNLGTTRVYNINYANAESNNGTSNRYEHVSGDGLPPSPVAGRVIIDGASVPFCIGCSANSPLEGRRATQAATVSRSRTRLYWYLEKN